MRKVSPPEQRSTEADESRNEAASTVQQPASLVLKDWIGFGFSSIALVASVLSLWLSNFYTNYDAFLGETGEQTSFGVSGDDITIITTLVVANNGTRPIILTAGNLDFEFNNPSDNLSTFFLFTSLPKAIAAHDIQFFRIIQPVHIRKSELDRRLGSEPTAKMSFVVTLLDTSGTKRKAEVRCVSTVPGHPYGGEFKCDSRMIAFKSVD